MGRGRLLICNEIDDPICPSLFHSSPEGGSAQSSVVRATYNSLMETYWIKSNTRTQESAMGSAFADDAGQPVAQTLWLLQARENWTERPRAKHQNIIYAAAKTKQLRLLITEQKKATTKKKIVMCWFWSSSNETQLWLWVKSGAERRQQQQIITSFKKINGRAVVLSVLPRANKHWLQLCGRFKMSVSIKLLLQQFYNSVLWLILSPSVLVWGEKRTPKCGWQFWEITWLHFFLNDGSITAQ